MSKELKKLLQSPDKLVKKADNALAKMFRMILADLAVEIQAWNKLVTRYFKSPFSKTLKTPKDIGQDRNNFNRAIVKDSLTWKNFIIALMILGPTRIDLQVRLTWRNGTTTSHNLPIDNPLKELDEVVKKVDEGEIPK